MLWAPLMVPQRIKNLALTQEMWVRSLGQENPLEKGMVTHSSILAWPATVHRVAESDMTEVTLCA